MSVSRRLAGVEGMSELKRQLHLGRCKYDRARADLQDYSDVMDSALERILELERKNKELSRKLLSAEKSVINLRKKHQGA